MACNLFKHTPGNKCCPVVECTPCAQKSGLLNWAVSEQFLGFVLSGTFGSTNEACEKTGCDCARQDNIFVTEIAVVSPWSNWLGLYSCGSCLDCSNPGNPVELPPCATDLSGNLDCGPSYPTYFVVEYQTRSGIREKLFYSKGVELCVRAKYVGTNSIRFFATLRYRVWGNATAAFATKKRWRRRVLQCRSNNVIDPGTPSSDDSMPVPEPLTPCNDVLGDIGTYCDPFDPPDVPSSCESVTSVTIQDLTCEEISLAGCVNNPKSVSLDTYASRNCCDDADLCNHGFDFGTVQYESQTYSCDNLPASIPMAAVLGFPANIVLGFFCMEGITPPADILFTIPEIFTLTVSA